MFNTKSRERIQCEKIDRQIEELKNLQNYLIPGWNSEYIVQEKKRFKLEFVSIPLIILAGLFISDMIFTYLIMLALFSLPFCLISLAGAELFLNFNYTLAKFSYYLFNLASFFVLLGLHALLAMFITACIK